MSNSTMVLLVSQKADRLASALLPFREAGFQIVVAPDLVQAGDYLDPKDPPALVLLDSTPLPPAEVRREVMVVLERCALAPLTVVSDLSPGDFHELMEGLGMLAPLPSSASRADGEALLKRVEKLRQAMGIA